MVETYKFPKRGELRKLLTKVWPEKGHRPLVEQVLKYAECEVAADGLPAYLALAIENYCEPASSGLRWACYATLPPLIRALCIGDTRTLALNEYCALFDRLCRAEAKYFQVP